MVSNISRLIPKLVILIDEAKGTVQAPVAEADLVAFEQRWQIVLPADMREFYAMMNGTGDSSETVTDFLFRIWPLEEIRPIPNIEPAPSLAEVAIEGAANYLCFSDYLIISDVYAIHAAESTPVISICAGHRQVATSFSDFLEQLVTDFTTLL